MPRLLRLPVPNSDHDISLEQTVASSDGRPSEPPARSRAKIAFDETHVGESSSGQVSKDMNPSLVETRRPEDPAALPAPRLGAGEDEQRLKALIKGKLFRKATPVKIGRFTVLDRLGEGGMGVVYTAYDDQLDRKVAIKVLRGEATREDSLGRARLMREAQAMARLSHPNIVTVHEVGDHDGQVYVAMEFVRGMSLDAWLKKPDRPWRETLAVFLQAGRGLQAAHEAGIIHRDFKPHNVLVGDDGAVKVLDFGLARATEHAGTEDLARTPSSGESEGLPLLSTPLTQTGAIMGTPAYMAPEQHEGRPASAASDQFSFCVSLYEGLYDQHPFATSSLAALIADVIGGRVAPPPPSARAPARLFKCIQRGLAVAAERRFPSMAELLAELARDPEARRRRAFTTTALAGLVGAASFGAAALQQPAAAPICAAATDELAAVWTGAHGEAVRSAMLATGVPYAAETWSKVQPQLDAYAAAWVAMRTEACETHASGHQSDLLFDLRTACLDQRRAGFSGLVDALASADPEVVQKAVQAASSLPPLERCGDVAALTADVPPPEDPRTRVRVQGLRETLARAKAQEDAGRYAAGLATLAPVVEEAGTLDYPQLVAEALLRQGSLQMESGALAEADASFERALWTAVAGNHDTVAAQAASKRLFLRATRMGQVQEAVREIPLAQALSDRVASNIDIRAEFLNNLGTVYIMGDDVDRAREALLAAVELRKANGRAGSLDQAFTLSNLGYLATSYGQERESVRYTREAIALAAPLLGESHPTYAMMQSMLSHSLVKQGKVTEAHRLLSEVVERPQASPSGAVSALAALGSIALEERRYDAAHRYFREAISIAMEHPEFASAGPQAAQLGLGKVLAEEENTARTREYFARLVAQTRDQFGADHPQLHHAQLVYGDVLIRLGEPREALAQFQMARARCLEEDTSSKSLCADIRFSTALALARLGELDLAEVSLREVLAEYERLEGSQGLMVPLAAKSLGELLLERGQRNEAVELLRRAETGYAAMADADYPKLAETRFALARALAGATTPPEARALARSALDVFKARGEPWAPEARAVETWLAAHPG